MHEIITLQLGRQSNYVATHFWNAQESYFTYGDAAPSPVNHDIHWRAGLGADGTETYLPRTLVYDHKGGFGSLRKVNALYATESDNDTTAQESNWKATTGGTVLHTGPRIAPSAYTQSLDAGTTPKPLTAQDVRYWSDFGRVYYHPRSLVEVGNEPVLSGSSGDSDFSSGDALFTSLDREHDLLDRDLRPFVEEADRFQGIQVVASVDDSWGGFAARYLERMRDEYGKATVWLWAVESSDKTTIEHRRKRLANKARALAAAYEQASLTVPVSMPPVSSSSSLRLEPSIWHASAAVATAWETVTLPARLRTDGAELAYLTELLNATGKQSVANLQMQVGKWKVKKGEQEEDEEIQLDIDFAPKLPARPSNGWNHKKRRMFGQALVTRGEEEEESDDRGGQRDERSEDNRDQRNERSEDQKDQHEELRRRRFALQPVHKRFHTSLAFPLLDSFPPIYGDNSNKQELSLAASLATDSTVADGLEQLRTAVAGPRGLIGIEDREALGNDLAGMVEAYHDGWSSGSDMDDD